MTRKDYQVYVGMASCGIASGADLVFEKLVEAVSPSIAVEPTGCLGICFCEPLVEVRSLSGQRYLYGNVTEDKLTRIINEHLLNNQVVQELLVPYPQQVRFALQNCGLINPEDLHSYIEVNGYSGLRKALASSPEAVINEIKIAGLRGRGGAGFPTHLKWSLARQSLVQPKYVICNADEGDPGAFMDRSILESDPHSVLEGILIAGYAIGAEQGFIYVRAEYPLAIQRLRLAIQQAMDYNLLGKQILGTDFNFDIQIREGAGAFVCGEETALLMSIEGQRGMPRFRPPYPVDKGLFDCPTVINNVETLANVPRIMEKGAAVFNQYGTKQSTGTKVFALTGDVKHSGLVEIPMGTTINELVFEIGGGISTGGQFKAIQTGGPSGGCIPAELGATPVDYESLAEIGAIMGSGGLLVMDDATCMVNVAQYFLSFASAESCGKCTFCRIGTQKMLEILNKITAGQGELQDLETLEELGKKVAAGSMCGLGQTAPNPLLTTLKYFRPEYEAHILEKRCPAKQCQALIDYQIDSELCRSCGLCKQACPVNAITGSRQEAYQINQSVCIRCGLCVSSCKFAAILISAGEVAS
ncbi:MAG: NADH-quinone oxidoreductase subunit NuoF [Firmicutes bacterium]|nr:NADH-quinone oxidoreductase subunit NuoF [Bacillota bacterium]